MSPVKANVPVETVVTIQGKGGFQPYTYTQMSGGGSLDPMTGIFDAPSSADTVTIEVTDYFGAKAQGTLEVFEQLKLLYSGVPVSQLIVALADLPLDFDASGGPAPYVYVFSVAGASASIDAGGWFDALDAGEYLVEVSDSLENSAIATVKIVDIGGPLTISPETAYVRVGQTVDFTGYNFDPTTFAFSVDTPAAGSITPDTNPAAYTAPGVEAIDTVRLTDAIGTVTATVYVLSDDPPPLVISPSSFGDDLKYGDVVTFTASGGLPPYTFWLEYDDGHGTLKQISAAQALYTAPNFNTVDWVWAKDALGNSVRVKTKVKSG